jgi:GxxExxY protein
MTEDELTYSILNSVYKVHSALGPGLLESAYETCLYHELTVNNNFKVERQKKLPVIYENVQLDAGYVIDLYIEDKIILELKSVDKLNEVHMAQILTYLKLSKCKIGYLLNFNVKSMVDGIKRVINSSI